MVPTRQQLFFFLLLILCGVYPAQSWDNQELELFDLVEEVNANFYETLGVEQTATSAEIRRAYRKLSVKLHPDKNKEEDAEEKFRRVVAIYEVLKDEQQRTRYNEILVNGLPDWRTPVYYYRKARKLGLVELAVLLSIIITVGQFIVTWAMYYERKFEMEEVFNATKKKNKKSKKSKQQSVTEEDMDDALQEYLDSLPKPKLTNLLPCKLVLGTISLFASIPSWVQQVREYREEQRRLKEMESSEDEGDGEEAEEKVKRPKRRQRVDIPEYEQLVPEGAPVVYMTDIQSQTKQKKDTTRVGQDWTDDEVSFLAKAVAKYPSGTVDRWEKIAELVGRSVNEVTAKAKSIKQKVTIKVDPASQGLTGSVTEKLNFKKGLKLSNDITRACDTDKLPSTKQQPSATVSDKKHVAAAQKQTDKTDGKKTAENSKRTANGTQSDNTRKAETAKTIAKAPSVPSTAVGAAAAAGVEDLGDPSIWTQTQQKTLEWALGHYAKGTPERWEKVAEHITGKTKEDCIARFKHLAEVIKRKRAEAAIAKDSHR